MFISVIENWVLTIRRLTATQTHVTYKDCRVPKTAGRSSGRFYSTRASKKKQMNVMDWTLCYAKYEYFSVPPLLSLKGEKSGKVNWTEYSAFLTGTILSCFRLFIKRDRKRKQKPMNVLLALKRRSLSILHSDRGCEIMFPNSGGV